MSMSVRLCTCAHVGVSSLKGEPRIANESSERVFFPQVQRECSRDNVGNMESCTECTILANERIHYEVATP